MLDREEYVEQAHFFGALADRTTRDVSIQDLLVVLREEALATTKLPMAIDFLLGELLHAGVMSSAMRRLSHYFTAFQTYIMTESENEQGRFDMRTGLHVLRREAEYRAGSPTPQGVFLYQFETLCRNRLRYDPGLEAISQDPIFNQDWRDWILTVRRQIGMVDLADLIYVRSRHLDLQRQQAGDEPLQRPILFDQKEGKIALANRHKDPLLLFSALQRHLAYPAVPRLVAVDKTADLLPQLLRRMERVEARLKLVEEEHKEGIDITRFYQNREPGQ